MQIFAGGVALPARLGALPRDFRAVAPVPVPVLRAKSSKIIKFHGKT